LLPWGSIYGKDRSFLFFKHKKIRRDARGYLDIMETTTTTLTTEPYPYFEIVIGFLIIVYVFETYLEIRQRRRYKSTVIPDEIKDIVKEETFTKAQQYGYAKKYIWINK